jgi:deazaflavin-dependent oxidoreductase (nitroreductase family)
VATPQFDQVAAGVYGLAIDKIPSNVYFVRSGTAWVLIDTAWANSSKIILETAESLFGPRARPAAILLTHLHPDHSGSARRLAELWGVPIFVAGDELPMATGGYAVGEHPSQEYPPLDRWLIIPVVRLLPRGVRARMRAAGDLTGVVHGFDPEVGVPELPDWQCVPTPGHTRGHDAFYRNRDRVLISGDAVLTLNANSLWDMVRGIRKVSGPPRYFTWNWPEAVRSIAALARLQPQVLVTGHGDPLRTSAARQSQALADQLAGSGSRGRRRAQVRRWLPKWLFRPVDYSGRAHYRQPPKGYARIQWLGFLLTKLGLSPQYVITLEVRGRKSGLIRRTNLVQVTQAGEHYLVALAGESEWVRNVRAAAGRVVIGRRRRRYAATLVEVPPPDRPAIIRAYLLRPGRHLGSKKVTTEARYFFGLSAGPSLEEIRQIADRYPVFRVIEHSADS